MVHCTKGALLNQSSNEVSIDPNLNFQNQKYLLVPTDSKRLVYLSIYILIKLWSSGLYDWLYVWGRAYESWIRNGCSNSSFLGFLRIIFCLCKEACWIFMHPKPHLRFWIFEIKYYNNIRANFLSYFNVNVYFITIIHYLNN